MAKPSHFFYLILLAHVHLRSDFCSEVFLLLLDALALFKADSVDELDLAAKLLGSGGHVLLNGDSAILDERLLEQAVLLVELVDLAGMTIFSLTCWGLEAILGSLSIWATRIFFSSARTSSVTWLLSQKRGFSAAICIATSLPTGR